jgi:hypothetical protein
VRVLLLRTEADFSAASIIIHLVILIFGNVRTISKLDPSSLKAREESIITPVLSNNIM